jgi:hypothetical protein
MYSFLTVKMLKIMKRELTNQLRGFNLELSSLNKTS